MIYTFIYLLSLSSFAIPASACEGQCIIQITNAFVGNYSEPVEHVFADLAADIARTLLPSHSKEAASKLVKPLLDMYHRGAYDSMEKAIFPGFFHGKCQVDGVDPEGCPNPDCPVVCGTPGSMVHFYGILKQLAFNITASNLNTICSPSSKTYKTFESAVLHARHTATAHRRSLRTATLRARSGNLPPFIHGSDGNLAVSGGELQKRDSHGNGMSDEVKLHLRSACRSIVKDLERGCGGITELLHCSWEKAMKTFILSFP